VDKPQTAAPAPPPPPPGAKTPGNSDTVSDAPPPVAIPLATPAAAAPPVAPVSRPGDDSTRAAKNPLTVSAEFRKAVAPDEEIDPRLEQFLQKAAPILAVERGINAKSRVLMGAVARDLGLSDDEFESAVKALQHGRKESGKSSADPAVDAFYRYLHAKLEKFKGILTLDLQQKAVEMAREKFQVEEEAARQAIADVATELRVRRITLADAERHIAGLISQKVGDSAWLDDETTDRLRAAGREWGMNALQVDSVVRRHMTLNQESQKKEHRFVMGAVVTAVGVVILLVGVMVWQIVLTPMFSQPEEVASTDGTSTADGATADADPGTPTTDGASDGGAAPAVYTGPPPWWSNILKMRQIKARQDIPDYGPIYEGLASGDPTRRGEAYRQLVAASRSVLNEYDPTKRKSITLREVIAYCHLLDPDEQAVAQLREALAEQAAPNRAKLLESTLAFDQAVWAVRAADWALKMDGLDEARADQLAQAMSRAVGTTIDRHSEKSLLAQCLPGIVAQTFQSLTTAVATDPTKALQLYQILFTRFVRNAEFPEISGDSLLTRVMTDFLVAYLGVAESEWKQLGDPIRYCANLGSAIDKLKLLEVFERTEDPTLQSFLGGELIAATGTPVADLPIDQVAAAIRKRLGVSASALPTTPEDRWAKLQPLAEAALARPASSPVNQAGVLEETVELAWLASLASALAQQESGYPLFDELLKAGKPPLEAKPVEGEAVGGERRTTPSLVAAALPQSVRNDLERFFATLAQYRGKDALTRQNHLRGLASLADRLHDVTPAQGEAVAGYLLGEKPEAEHRGIEASIEPVTHWPSVRLALADRIESSPLPDELAAQVVSKALRRDISPEGRNWRAAARQQLLRDVLVDLQALSSAPPEATSGDPLLDLASAALQTMYRERARQLRLDQAVYNSTKLPGETLALLVGQTQSQVSAGNNLNWLPPRLEVIDYLSSHDLERTVALQRVWLKLLALQVRKLGSQQGGRADELVRQLEQRDASASHLLAQLRDGEETTLRMWLLYGPSGMGM
jgi:hypothetical protein